MKSCTMKVHHLSVTSPDPSCKLQASLRHAMRLARWTGLFPVQGLGQNSAEETRFNIKCIYSCYLIATLIGQVIMVSCSIMFFFQNDVALSSISNIVFHATALTSAILLIVLSQRWPTLMLRAAKTERVLTELELDNKPFTQSSMIAYSVMMLAVVEHLLCTSFYIKYVISCLRETGLSSNVMENYVVLRMSYVFNYVPYNMFNVLLFEVFCLQSTFLWSFNDVMITCFSIYITAYFRNFNKIISANSKADKDKIPWSVLRVHYSNLIKLVKDIDSHINSFILIAFFTDLFYICLQLFNNLHRNNVSSKYCDEAQAKAALTSPSYLLYYLYSFIFLVLRTMMLSLFASNVHCAALEPIYSVYDIPATEYDIEARRFQLQLHHAEVGLTGKFFNVTRNMILQVVGTIITYEIVLLQYSITPDIYPNTTTSTIFPVIVENVTNLYGQS